MPKHHKTTTDESDEIEDVETSSHVVKTKVLTMSRMQSILTKVQALSHYSHYITELTEDYNTNKDKFDTVYKGVVGQLLKLKLKSKPVLKVLNFLVELAVAPDSPLTEYTLKLHSQLTAAADVIVRQRSIYIVMRVLNSLPDNFTLPEDLHDEVQQQLVERLKDKSADVRVYSALSLKRFHTRQLAESLSDPRAQVVVAALQSIAIDETTIVPIIRLTGDMRNTVREYAFKTVQNIPISSITITSLCYILLHGLCEDNTKCKSAFEELVVFWVKQLGYEEFLVKISEATIPALPPGEADNRSDFERYSSMILNCVDLVSRLCEGVAGVELSGSDSEVIVRSAVLIQAYNKDPTIEMPDSKVIIKAFENRGELCLYFLLELLDCVNCETFNVLEVVRNKRKEVVEVGCRVLVRIDESDHFGQICDELKLIEEDAQNVLLHSYYIICIEKNYILPEQFLDYHVAKYMKLLGSSEESERVETMEFIGLTALVNVEDGQKYETIFRAGLTKDTDQVRVMGANCLIDLYLLSHKKVTNEIREELNDALLSLDAEFSVDITKNIIRLYLNGGIDISEEREDICLAKTLMSMLIRSPEGSVIRVVLYSFFVCYSLREDGMKLYEMCLDEAGPELEKITEVYVPMLAQEHSEVHEHVLDMCIQRLGVWSKDEEKYPDETLSTLINVFYLLDYSGRTKEMKEIVVDRLKVIETQRNSQRLKEELDELIQRFEELD
ncbi:hypothetical protein EIN_372150 [Entamoeba invadens IP1]|uniref:Uncharacterized protein n=1 Tax=Entamoeba invadens IP1 TaxID=370355 RepID=A0A0A1UCC2_ENTIV|nr:hypothetical protein EIN_372150 [Entamoeba invadens IP1]ELP92793.1 hypothetical protein EIN_372150 [Entamoeba invadens IP1]|eukprot:XP_004259564.1 hypothetical protein EIN_372150 [Entamoeba invadens IP1]